MRGWMILTLSLLWLHPSTLLADDQDAWLYSDEMAAAEAAAAQPSAEPDGITRESFLALLDEKGLAPEADGDRIVLYKDSTRIFADVDVAKDAFRLGVPIAKTETMKTEKPLELLKANYEATGDARFAVNHGVVWLVFTHPVSSLSERDILVNIDQLARNSRLLTDE